VERGRALVCAWNCSIGAAEQQHTYTTHSPFWFLCLQVEVACVERGRALVCAWNCSMGAAESALVELQAQNKQLLGLNSRLVDEQQELAKELKGVDFLR
jgi:hypothetical protein